MKNNLEIAITEILEQSFRHHEKFHQVEFEIMAKVTGTFSIKVNPAATPLVITPASATLPDKTVGVPVDGQAVATVSGGVPPYSYAMDPTSGPLPDGVTLNETGTGVVTLQGTPTKEGTFPFAFNVTDAAGATTHSGTLSGGAPTK